MRYRWFKEDQFYKESLCPYFQVRDQTLDRGWAWDINKIKKILRKYKNFASQIFARDAESPEKK